MTDFKCDNCGSKMGKGDFQTLPDEYNFYKDENNVWHSVSFDWFCKKCFEIKMRKFKLKKLAEL